MIEDNGQNRICLSRSYSIELLPCSYFRLLFVILNRECYGYWVAIPGKAIRFPSVSKTFVATETVTVGGYFAECEIHTG